MADFVCKVGDASGRIFQQVETAQSEDEARQKLADRGFYVFSVRNQFDLLSQFSQAGRERKIRPADFLIFNQQFNTLVRAGLPILRALDLLAERAAAPRLAPDPGRRPAARTRRRIAVRGDGGAGIVSSGLYHGNRGGRA